MWYIVMPMNEQKKKGIIIIVIGICIPLFILPFLSGYDKDKGFIYNFNNVGIRIKHNVNSAAPQVPPGTIKGQKEKKPFSPGMLIPAMIPFRLLLVPTFILLFIGIVMIDKARPGGSTETGSGD